MDYTVPIRPKFGLASSSMILRKLLFRRLLHMPTEAQLAVAFLSLYLKSSLTNKLTERKGNQYEFNSLPNPEFRDVALP